MLPLSKALYAGMARWHRETYEKLQTLSAHTRNCADPHELADIGYTLREMERLTDDIHKKLRADLETCQQVSCAICHASKEMTVRTPYVTASVDVKLQAKVPKRSENPEAYDALLKELGVPKHLIESGLFEVRWPELCTYITERTRDEKPLPPGVDPELVKPLYRMRYLGKLKPNEETGA